MKILTFYRVILPTVLKNVINGDLMWKKNVPVIRKEFYFELYA